MNVKKRLHQIAISCLICLLALTTVSQWPKHVQAESGNGNSLNVKAKSAILVDANTGQILYSKNADAMLPPASMTKIMTEYVVLKEIHSGKINWNTKVNISDKVYSISQNREFSNVPLRKDYQYTIKDLYYPMAIYSADGAAVALAEAVGGGDEKKFVDLMNKTAKELGMNHTKFVNSSGLDNVDLKKNRAYGGPNSSNLITARDLAKLTYHLVQEYPEILKIASIPQMKFTAGVDKPIQMVNWDWMLPGLGKNMKKYAYPGLDGLKTGHTDLAGYCFTGTAERNGHRLISVVMGTGSEDARFTETKKLLDYGFDQFNLKTILKKGQAVKGHETLPVSKGKDKEVKIVAGKPLELAVKNSENANYKVSVHLDKSKLNQDGQLKAPVKKGEKVGYLMVSDKGQHGNDFIYNAGEKVPVVTADQVDKANWFVLSMRSVGHFISGAFVSAFDAVKALF
ncbi:D-alanyl-D-alanine carboxypeptidase (penicillin-binding protein 5/6) [Scopulibacillus daqui]|uniref:serine-type D-Ala-D-Ala carboxypeptidase n=1 Tax=Scopulibacillus daqui TaxID=1469162 RepID=A0ABS2PZS6_9BACL|nr:D-alanyl-D-alanine carboxypeptidase (penicillin-binding protein 5/6) [Scopulibacillus daqui]